MSSDVNCTIRDPKIKLHKKFDFHKQQRFRSKLHDSGKITTYPICAENFTLADYTARQREEKRDFRLIGRGWTSVVVASMVDGRWLNARM